MAWLLIFVLGGLAWSGAAILLDLTAERRWPDPFERLRLDHTESVAEGAESWLREQ